MARVRGQQPETAGAKAGAVARTAGNRKWAKKRYKLRATTTASTRDKINRHNLQFGLREQIAYHAIREQALARLSRLLTGVQVFLGTSAIASMTEILPVDALWSVVASALAGVVLLVVDPAGGARDHRALRSRFHHVLADMEEGDGSAENLRMLKAARERISADVPPAYRVVQAIAYNTAVNATYLEADAAKHRYHIGFWRRIFANWIPMRGFKFDLESKRAAQGNA